jgi:hypothetical protein
VQRALWSRSEPRSGDRKGARPGTTALSIIALACSFASAFSGVNAAAQRLPAPPGTSNAPSATRSEPAPQRPVTADSASVQPRTAEEIPASPPQVSYADGQLTINAMNSTLGDILKAVRAVTGADIDIPAKAARERMAARLGPGPAREVISSLLGWTDYNYLIQASDNDANSIQTVLLTPRPKSSIAVASAARGQTASDWTRRLTPANPPAAAEAESETSPEGAAEALPASGNQQNSSANAQSAPPATPPATSTPAAANTPAPATASTTVSATEDQPVQAELAASAKDPGADQAAKNSERMMELQSLYEQRKQMMEDARKPSTQN